jgi:two-component system sensor histidine kinase DevS
MTNAANARLSGISHHAAAERSARQPGLNAHIMTATPLWETVVTPAVVWKMIEACPDGLALADATGALVLVNRRMEELFGYDRTEMLGSPVERLIPTAPRAADQDHRAGYRDDFKARPAGAVLALSGLRKDGSTFPVEISISPMRTQEGQFTIAAIRDVSEIRSAEAAERAAAVLASQDLIAFGLHDTVVSKLFEVGLSLQGAVDLPGGALRDRVLEAVRHLDETICDIRDTVFGLHRKA